MMRCESCNKIIEKGEEKVWNGLTLCEDCYLDRVSQLKACDPWAVYSAKNLMEERGNSVDLTPVQKQILDTLEEKGAMEPETLADLLNISREELEREIATLRHMEKTRGEMRDGKKVICLW